VVKSILYEGTIALGTSIWTLGRICEDLSLEVIAVDLGGGRRLWRHDAGSVYLLLFVTSWLIDWLHCRMTAAATWTRSV